MTLNGGGLNPQQAMVVSHDPRTCKHVCVQLRTSGINVALPAFAAARRAASAPAVQQSIARLAHSSNTTARCCSRRMGQTDRQTDTVPLHRPCPAYYAGSVRKWWFKT